MALNKGLNYNLGRPLWLVVARVALVAGMIFYLLQRIIIIIVCSA
jgi:hypothetical protein